MKKDYMKPEGTLLVLSANENIATSDRKPGGAMDTFGINYRIEGDTMYLFDSNIPACTEGPEATRLFVDLINTYIYPMDANCRFDP